MRRISKYTTAQDNDLRGLDKRVNNLIEMGYQPYGSPYSAFNGRSVTLCQALVKYEGDEQDDTKSALAKNKLTASPVPKPAGLNPGVAPKPSFAPKPERAPAPSAPAPALPAPQPAPASASPAPALPRPAAAPPPVTPAPALPSTPHDEPKDPPVIIVEPLD